MGAGELNNQNREQWRRRHPYIYALSRVFIGVAFQIRKLLTILFATWPSMHDPIIYLLNAADPKEADKLTEKWANGKLQELQYVGLSVSRIKRLIAHHSNLLLDLSLRCHTRAPLSPAPSPPLSPGTPFKTILGVPKHAGRARWCWLSQPSALLPSRPLVSPAYAVAKMDGSRSAVS